MELHRLLTISQFAIWVGAVITASGLLGKYFIEEKLKFESSENAKAEALLQALPKLHFHELHAYYVLVQPNTYQLGVLARILNKDATRAFVVEGLAYQGGFQIGGGDAAFTMRNLRWYEGNGIVHGKYFLRPGDETSIKILLPSTVEMHIQHGTPGVSFNGEWHFIVEGSRFILKPEHLIVDAILSPAQWQTL